MIAIFKSSQDQPVQPVQQKKTRIVTSPPNIRGYSRLPEPKNVSTSSILDEIFVSPPSPCLQRLRPNVSTVSSPRSSVVVKRRNLSTRTDQSWITSTTFDNNKLPTSSSTTSQCSTTAVIKKQLYNQKQSIAEVSENPFCALYREFYPSQDDSTFSRQMSTIRPSVRKLIDGGCHFHMCSAADAEAFVGILNFKAAVLGCCPLKSFVMLTPDHDDYATAFTPFGRILLQMCNVQGHDLRFLLTDELLSSWWRDAKSRDLKIFLNEIVDCHVDSNDVRWQFGECSVCLASCRFVRQPPCCTKAICQTCWQSYVQISAAESPIYHQTGMYDLHCFGCSKIVPYGEALSSLEPADVALIRPPDQQLASGNSRCPVCLSPPPPRRLNSGKTKLTKSFSLPEKYSNLSLKKLRSKKGGEPVVCDRCENQFCSLCGLEKHPSTSCQQLIFKDKGLTTWMRQPSSESPEFLNGRRCPSCSIAVSRDGGCSYVTCLCGTNFCYSCGGKRRFKVGGHELPMSHNRNRLIPIVSCPKLWRSQATRITVHSLISFGVIAAGVPLAVALSPVAVPLGLVGCMVVRSRQQRQQRAREH